MVVIELCIATPPQEKSRKDLPSHYQLEQMQICSEYLIFGHVPLQELYPLPDSVHQAQNNQE
jgi:hypothetical protein